MRNHSAAILLIFLGLFMVVSCAGKSKNARFYMLSSMKAASVANKDTQAQPADLALGIGPVTIADYLNRQGVVTRDSQNQLKVSEFEQWAGSFKNNIIHALADNLGVLLGTDRIHIHPWRKYVPIDYQVTVNVIRFDGKPGQEAWLTSRWSLINGQTKEILTVKRSSIQTPVEDNSYEALVAAQSLALAKMSREVADAIKATQ
jgi:uncharacterized lipoprotein YmbA